MIMPRPYEIAADMRASRGLTDAVFKAVLLLLWMPVILICVPLRGLFYPCDVLYCALVFFQREFACDIHRQITDLNNSIPNRRLTSCLNAISPRLAGYISKCFGYIVTVLLLTAVSAAVYCTWLLVLKK
jgi:hypothetical protein